MKDCNKKGIISFVLCAITISILMMMIFIYNKEIYIALTPMFEWSEDYPGYAFLLIVGLY